MPQEYGNDSYTTVAAVQTYLDRTLSASELAVLAYVIPAVSRWIDRTLGTCFDNLPTGVPFDAANPANPLCGWSQKHFGGGYNEINVRGCQQILLVQAVSPYDNSVWYTYTSPIEYIAEPYDYAVRRSLRMRRNEYSTEMRWPGGVDGILVTALFTEYDYVNDCYPSDIVLLANHVCAIWLQNNQNADAIQTEQVEGHKIIKRLVDLMATDPMVTRVLQSREEVWLEEM